MLFLAFGHRFSEASQTRPASGNCSLPQHSLSLPFMCTWHSLSHVKDFTCLKPNWVLNYFRQEMSYICPVSSQAWNYTENIDVLSFKEVSAQPKESTGHNHPVAPPKLSVPSPCIMSTLSLALLLLS